MIAKVLVNLLMCCCVMGRPPPRRAFRDVTTSQGAARGYLAPRGHYAFLGLPYARPPTRHDRFKAPEPPPNWDGIFEATHRIKCPQPDGEGDENCLVINVFTPEHAASCCMLPVLVHVHAGGFHSGWGSYQPPSRFVQDFVVVTFNYRLGALGFLCLGSPGAPGNAGLKDQVAALYWVHRNIENFGGNSHDVTLYGTGSGATSIQLLLLCGLTSGLFHRVILESGSVLSPSSMAYEPFSTGLNIATSLGYNDEGNNLDLDEFYEKISLSELVNLTMFLPCVENNLYYSHSLLEKDPVEILEQGNFDKVPMLVAYNDAEEASLIADNTDRFNEVPGNFELLLPNNLEFANDETKHRIADVIKEFYFSDSEWNENVMQNYIEYINDIVMDYPVVKFSVLYASKSPLPVYLMKFSYKSASQTDVLESNYETILKYFYASDNLEIEDEQMAHKLVTLWSNFIKFGDPTPLTTTLIPVVWQPVNLREGEIEITKVPSLDVGRTLKMDEHSSSQRLSFWDHVYRKFYKLHTFGYTDTDLE